MTSRRQALCCCPQAVALSLVSLHTQEAAVRQILYPQQAGLSAVPYLVTPLGVSCSHLPARGGKKANPWLVAITKWF